MELEIRRIKDAYRRRMQERPWGSYSLFNKGELYMAQRREETILQILNAHSFSNLQSARILDIGCGRGTQFADWLRWGACPKNVFGIDLMEPFVIEARKNVGQNLLVVGSAHQLPYADASFDIVTQFTVFTSIQSGALRRAAAMEMRRVLSPGGIILWYDLRYSNPRNKDIQGIGLSEIKCLFEGYSINHLSLNLIPPLTRRLAPLSIGACRILEAVVPPFRCHYLAVIREGQ